MSDAITRGRKALQRIHQRNEDSRWQYGTMGRLLSGVPTFAVTGRPGFVYVTIRLASGAQTSPVARNDAGLPYALGLPVRMKLENGVYVIDSIARRADLATTDASTPSGVLPHIHDDRYFSETEVLTAADLGAPADTDTLLGVRAGALGSILWSAIKTALNVIYARLAAANTFVQNNTIASTATTGSALKVIRDLTSTSTDAPVVDIVQDNTGDDQAALRAQQDGTGKIISLLDGATEVFYVLDGGNVVAGEGGTAGNATRALNLIGAAAVMRILRISADSTTAAPAFELIHRTTADGSNTAFWDVYVDINGYYIRDRTTGTNLRLYVDTSGNFGIGIFASLGGRLHVLQSTLGQPVLALQSSSSADDPTWRVVQNRITTTNATPATLHTFAIAASNTHIIEVTVIARRTGGTAGTADDGAAYSKKSAYTTKAGVVTLLGVIMESIDREDVAAYDCQLVISGTNVIVQVTGVANTNITWHLVKGEVGLVGT